jgi:UDP-N-acetylmuramoyl-tripeptide--D-alanyl-D-alanine ligase
MTLWTAAEAVAATGGKANGNWTVTGVSIDTRTLEPGDLFVALKAARDGHEFVAQALAGGAGAALVTHVPEGVNKTAPLLIVEDVQTALEALGRAARARTHARIVAVTGSVGKTSTKEMLACMLADQGRMHAAVASYNNHWGVPLTLARMPRDTDYAVIEIGMNHPGEIAPLARQARPDVAMITTVAAVHLEAFANVAAIAREKASIFEGLEPGGTAIINADIPEAGILHDAARAQGAKLYDFGTAAAAFELLDVTVSGQGNQARAIANGRRISFTIQSLGQHFAMNALGALAAVSALGADLDQAIKSLGHWSPFKGRGACETLPFGHGSLTVLDDSYNANPTSMGAALEVLAATPGQGRRIAFVGDMKELGPQEEALHAGLADHPAMGQVDQVHCIGPLMRALFDALPPQKRGSWHATSAEVLPELHDHIHAGDIVLAKGSLSMALGRIVDDIRKMRHGGTKLHEPETE